MSFLESVHRWRLKAERLEKRVVLAGNDDVDLLKVKASRVGISTGDGSDDVYLLNVGAPDLFSVFQGAGEDRLELEYCFSNSPEFNGRTGTDVFVAEPNYFAPLSSFYASNYEIIL